MKLIILHSVLQFPDHSDYTAALIESSPFFIYSKSEETTRFHSPM